MSLHIVFYGSAYFVEPLLKAVHLGEGKKLGQLALNQFRNLAESSKLKKILHENIFKDPILDCSVHLSLVVSQPDRLNRKKLVRNPISQYSLDNKISLFQPQSIKSSLEDYHQYGHQDIGLVAAYGQILPVDLIEYHRYGLINWHPSKLPQYRGPTPVQTALLNDDSMSALSWIDVAQKMDSGDIYLQTDVGIDSRDTFSSLMNTFVELGVSQWALAVALKIIDKEMISETFSPRRQKFSEATFCGMIRKEMKYVPQSANAFEVYNHYRAYIDFPKSVVHSKYFQSDITINRVSGVLSKEDFVHLMSTSSKVEKHKDFYSVYPGDKKQKRIFWATGSGCIELTEITLPDGKRVNLTGFNF